jgi:hypothetical protein
MNRKIYIKKIIKFLFVFISGLLFFISLTQTAKAQGASFYLSPSKGYYKEGDIFSVNVFVSTEGTAINAAEATINFPPENLRVLSITKQNSIFSLWVQEPSFSNSLGTISFGGGLPSPGFLGKTGKIMTISFQGMSSGEAKVNFSREKILANDAWGTNVFSFSKEATFYITTPEFIPSIIDNEPPYPFEIIVDNEGDQTNPQPLLYFETTDDISGISHYEMKIGEGDSFKISEGETTPYRLPLQAPGIHLVIVKAVDKAQNFTEESADVKVDSIGLPEFTVCPSVFHSGDEKMYLAGTATPDSQVLVFLKKNEKLVKQWEITADKKGDWFLIEDGLFKSGIYQITARTKNVKGAISHESSLCSVKIVLAGITIGPLILSYKTLTIIFLIISLLILIGIIYLFLGIRRTRRIIKRETKDLKEKFYKEYKELQADIEKELEVLKKAKGERRISEAEKRREEELLKNLADVKEVLEKELKDIEEIK